ncbi:MAG: response regulator transcription factor [Acidimicrobiia bacterium]|nr:response regulator transcription factor [Acidimicrobiia bacterium]
MTDNGIEPGEEGVIDDDPELAEAIRIGLRRAGYHVMRAGSELLAGVSAFLDAVGGSSEAEDEGPQSQRIEVE